MSDIIPDCRERTNFIYAFLVYLLIEKPERYI